MKAPARSKIWDGRCEGRVPASGPGAAAGQTGMATGVQANGMIVSGRFHQDAF